MIELDSFFEQERTVEELIEDSTKLIVTRELVEGTYPLRRDTVPLLAMLAVVISFVASSATKMLGFTLKKESQIILTKQSRVYLERSRTIYRRKIAGFIALQLVNIAIAILATVVGAVIMN